MRPANCQLLACRGVVDTLPLVGVDNGRRASLPPAIACATLGWGVIGSADRKPAEGRLTTL